MRILVFAHDALLYGASRSLLTLLQNWVQKKDVAIKVLLPYGGVMEKELNAIGIENEVIAYPRCIYAYKKQSLIEKIKINYRYRIAQEKMSKNITAIVNTFQPQMIYTNTSVIRAGYDTAKKYQLPHVWHVREFGWEDYQLKYIPGKKHIQGCMQSSRCIFVSRALQQYWLSNHQNNSRVIYNGVIENIEKNQSVSFNDHQSIRFSLLGAIMPGKGQAIAIEAINDLKESYPGIRLNIYGDIFDGEYYQKILTLRKKYNLEKHVEMHPFSDDVNEVYKNTDILLNCSLNEGFGRTIIEAMGKGIPVVANNSGGIPELITHTINGLLYNGSSTDLAAQIKTLINNELLAETISVNAAQHAAENFGVKTYADAVFNILKETVFDQAKRN